MEGIEEGPATVWLQAHAGLAPPLSFELIAGGRSNLTYRVADTSGRTVVLRRPPVAEVLPTAHDMVREHRVVAALGPSRVPVPAAIGLCDDPGVIGAPFYVMEHVQGRVVRDVAAAERWLDKAGRWRASESLVEVLGEIHRVDLDAAGLGDLGRHEGYLARQLERWHGQFDRSQVEELPRAELVDALYERLSAAVPAQQETTLVHGDYRLDNTVLDGGGKVVAVLDWEICTLGDPLADVGLLMVYWSEAGDATNALEVSPTLAPGFASRKELRERYAALTGRDLGGLEYYVGFGYWKVACILQGVFSRYRRGAGGGDRSAVDSLGERVHRLAEAADAALAGVA